MSKLVEMALNCIRMRDRCKYPTNRVENERQIDRIQRENIDQMLSKNNIEI